MRADACIGGGGSESEGEEGACVEEGGLWVIGEGSKGNSGVRKGGVIVSVVLVVVVKEEERRSGGSWIQKCVWRKRQQQWHLNS